MLALHFTVSLDKVQVKEDSRGSYGAAQQARAVIVVADAAHAAPCHRLGEGRAEPAFRAGGTPQVWWLRLIDLAA